MDGREDVISEEQVLDEELGSEAKPEVKDDLKTRIESDNVILKTVDFDELKIEDIKIPKKKGK